MPLIAARPPAGAASRLNAGGSGYTLPAVPTVTGLAVDTASGASWTAVVHPTVTGYEIAAGASPSPTTIVASPSGKFTTAADLGLAAGTHYVRIRAVSPAETGSWSADVSVTVVDQIAVETAGTLSQDDVSGVDQSIGNFTVDADADQLLIFIASGAGEGSGLVTGVKYDGVAATLIEEVVEDYDVAGSVWQIDSPTLSTSAAVLVTTSELTDVVAGLVPISLGNATVLVGAKSENSWPADATLTRTVGITTEQNNSAIFVLHAESDGSADVTPESGQTEVVEDSSTSYNLEVSFKLKPAAGADTVGATSTTIQGKALIAVEIINTSESVAAPEEASVADITARKGTDAYGETVSGGETTEVDFRVTINPGINPQFAVTGVEVRLGPQVLVVALTDMGSNVWEGSTELLPGEYTCYGYVRTEAGIGGNLAEQVDVTIYATPTITSHSDGDTDVPLDDTVNFIPSGGTYDFQVATDSGFVSKVMDVTGLTDNFDQLTGLSGSTVYYMRVRDTDSDWSDVISFTTAAGDVTAPTWNSAPALSGTPTAVGETVSMELNENGTYWVVMTPTAIAAPSVAQIKAGNGGDGNPATFDETGALAASTNKDVVATGGSASTAYKMHTYAEDSAGNGVTGGVVSSAEFTTASAFTARHIVGAQYDHLYRAWDADFNPAGNWLQCIWFRPTALPGAIRYLLGVGFDPGNDEGWAVRSDSSDRLLVRYGHSSGESNIGTFSLSVDTDYLVSVYEVAGKLYFRVNATEVGDSGGNSIQAPATNGVKVNENPDAENSNGFDAYYRNYAILDSYNATEATALTEIRADIAAIYAAGRAAQFSTIAGLNGTLTHLWEMSEEVTTEVNTDRADSEGSLDFSSYGNIQSIDDSAI